MQQRVREIRRLTPEERWRHCPGCENPADLPSRGLSAEDLINNKLWWEGPEFLKKPESEWPNVQKTREMNETSLKELIKFPPKVTYSFVNTEKKSTFEDVSQAIDCSKYSSLKKLLRVTAYVLRFIRRLQSKKTNTAGMKELNASEIRRAETCWIKSIQAQTYEHEIQQIQLGGTTPLVEQLKLFINEDKIVCCEGRIHHSTIIETAKRPILLPTKHHFTNLVIRERHESVHHNGIREILNSIRERFWIPRGRETVKQIVRRCVVCKRVDGKPFKGVKEPPLPVCRVTEDPPFSNTGIDFAGPLYVKDDCKQKTYICLYTCASTRAIHLELTEDLSVRTFLLAFRRFTARRGLPTRLLSDNAKTFKAAAKEVKLISRSEEVQRYLATKGVTWQFIIEKAPWQGGFWERLVQSTKRCLKKVLGRTSLTFEELRTILVEIEATINNRPLTYMYDDEEGISYPLTRSQLIYGRQINVSPNDKQFEIVSTHQALTKKAKYQKRLLGQFTKRWKSEYLLNIREGSSVKIGRGNQSISAGDIVILKEDGTSRLFWRLAKIQDLIQSADGMTRAAKIRLVHGDKGKVTELRRPIQHLIPLELRMEPESSSQITEQVSIVPQTNIQTNNKGRPKRTAAVIGELVRKGQ